MEDAWVKNGLSAVCTPLRNYLQELCSCPVNIGVGYISSQDNEEGGPIVLKRAVDS